MLAVCAGHPDFEDIHETPLLDKDNHVIGYTCIVKRKGRSPVQHTYTIEDATIAGLWGKQGPWKQYPQRMLQMRARSFALRDSFSDALGGVRVAEEVQDYEVKNITPRNDAKAKIESIINVDKETGEVK